MKKFSLIFCLIALFSFNAMADNVVPKTENNSIEIASFSFSKKAKETASKGTDKINQIVEEAKEELNIIKNIRAKLRGYIILACIGIGLLLSWLVGLTFYVVKLWLKVNK